MNQPGRLKRRILGGVIGCLGLLGGGLVAYCATRPPTPPDLLDPGDFIGTVPDQSLIELETYPRLVPWELDSTTEENDASVLAINAQSYACKLNDYNDDVSTETFDHMKVSETADAVTIETWLGPPEREGHWRGCVGFGWGFPVQVKTENPLGNRELVDPACEMERYAHWVACRESKLIRIP